MHKATLHCFSSSFPVRLVSLLPMSPSPVSCGLENEHGIEEVAHSNVVDYRIGEE